MRKIIKLKEGDSVPEGARYLSSNEEVVARRQEWRRTPGIMGVLPLFGTETLYDIKTIGRVHYYEVDEKEA